jgi:hypothetical protein
MLSSAAVVSPLPFLKPVAPIPPGVRIPSESGQGFRREGGHRSDVKAATHSETKAATHSDVKAATF